MPAVLGLGNRQEDLRHLLRGRGLINCADDSADSEVIEPSWCAVSRQIDGHAGANDYGFWVINLDLASVHEFDCKGPEGSAAIQRPQQSFESIRFHRRLQLCMFISLQ